MNEEQIIKQIDQFIENNKTNLLNDIKKLVDIPSVEASAVGNAPFGENVDRALNHVLNLAKEMNLETKNVDGYFGYADIKGKSDKQIAAITHVDVVPAGNGWTHDPFDMIEKEGYILGRGVADDKGPCMLTLYMAKFFKENNIELPHTLRIMFGTNEESGMAGLHYYQTKYENPTFCFTPDANFPVCFGEKGLYGGTMISEKLSGNIIEFTGGVALNVVPDLASVVIKCDANKLPSQNNFDIENLQNGTVKITAHGKGGHASLPKGTVNAIKMLVDYLLDNNLCTEQENNFLNVLKVMLFDTDGKCVGIDSVDDVFDPLTSIGGTINMKDGVISQTVDIRYPTSITAQQITNTFKELAKKANATFKEDREVVPFVTDEKTEVVQTLIKTYNDVTGKNEKPFTMGGGTYARHFPCAVSFGPEESNADIPSWVGGMHGADEGISIDLLYRSLKIYILSIYRIMKLDFE